MTQECARPMCSQPIEDRGMWLYCSKECERIHHRVQFDEFVASFEDRDPITVGELIDHKEKAKRWTPETMNERIAELKERV